MQKRQFTCGRSYPVSATQWAPTRTFHDPNPPITLETAPTRGRVSFVEFEVPNAGGATPTRGRISFAELEVPFLATRGRVSFAEVEVPNLATRGRVSFAEFEVP